MAVRWFADMAAASRLAGAGHSLVLVLACGWHRGGAKAADCLLAMRGSGRVARFRQHLLMRTWSVAAAERYSGKRVQG